ncbi:MAG: isochorismatase family protein, partial [Actinobacteria bacterium]|nr:isochorismatase family protein [Actinomycetota bacterium]
MTDSELYSKQGFGQSSGFGVRPALLIVDLQVGFTDPEIFGGGNILDAVANTQVLLKVARDCKIPIAHTKIVYADDGSDAGVFCLKNPGLLQLTEDAPMSQIVAQLTPQGGELVVRKTQPSAFIQTQLAAWLINKAVDTVIVAGCTTSGCVRASVVDSMSHNFRTIVAEDAVG